MSLSQKWWNGGAQFPFIKSTDTVYTYIYIYMCVYTHYPRAPKDWHKWKLDNKNDSITWQF